MRLRHRGCKRMASAISTLILVGRVASISMGALFRIPRPSQISGC